MKQRPTLKDVAMACGLHHSTVSRSLRDSPLIPKATRDKVKRAAAKLGYQADPFLSALANRRNAFRPGAALANLAWVTNFETRDGWKDSTHNLGFFQGCCDRAKDDGCNLDVIWTGDRKQSGIESLLVARGVQGVILAPAPSGATEVPINSDHFHCVTLGMSYKRHGVIQICHDHYHSVFTLVHQLVAEGFRRPIFYATRETDQNVDYLMSHGFRYGVESSGLKVSPSPAYISWESTSADLAQIIVKDQPDVAIVHYRNWKGLEKALNALDCSIPGDLSVAVITLPDEEKVVGGVMENSHLMGCLAVDTLINLIIKGGGGNITTPRRLMVDGTIVKGTTIKGPRKP